MEQPTDYKFTDEQIEQVREALRQSERDMEQWRKDSRPTKEQMTTPLGPVGGRW